MKVSGNRIIIIFNGIIFVNSFYVLSQVFPKNKLPSPTLLIETP